jgi:hypothetical protein
MPDRPRPDSDTPPPPVDPAVEAALAFLGLGDDAPAAGDDDEANTAAARELVARATAGIALSGAEGIVPVAPPPGLRARLLDRIRQEQRFQFVRAEEGQWAALDGDRAATAKLLFQGARPGERTRLVRLAAGDAAGLADAYDPALLVVDGELWRGDERCGAGDFAQALSADDAPAWRAASPTTVLVVERASSGTSARRRPVVRVGADGWHAVAPGTRVRPLAGGAGEVVDLALLEMAPGGLLPEHEHGGLEEIFLLRGSCRAQGRCIRAGDYHRAGHGSEHEDTTTDEGCLMLVVLRKAA